MLECVSNETNKLIANRKTERMQIAARQPAAKQKGQAGGEENGRMCVSMRQGAEGGEEGRGGRWSIAASLKTITETEKTD